MSETRVCKTCHKEFPLIKFELQGSSRNLRRKSCRYCRGSKARRHRPPEELEQKRFTRALNATRYIITSAQNATPVDEKFFAALKVAAKHLDAELVVIPFRYTNPTSIFTKSNDYWAPKVQPYLHNTRKKLAPHLVLAADVKIQPTASSPLNGFESLTGAESCIIGSPKMQFRSVPAPSGRFPKILSTTGACTRRNYTDSKAGKLGAFHHFLGAIIVEIEGKTFHLRQINADRTDGSFIDLDKLYTVDGVKRAPPALGLVLGDTHARFADPKVDRATFAPGGIVETLNPGTLVFHDLLDGYAVNPHHSGNPFIARAKQLANLGNVRAEVQHAVNFVKRRLGKRQAVVVGSNHDNFLARWVINSDWRQQPANAEFYLETAQAMLASCKMTPRGAEYEDPFCYWVDKLKGDSLIRCLRKNESFTIGDIECGLHGHKGPNGAKGNLKALSRVGARIVIGHSHSPGIEEGGYQCGTSSPLSLEYCEGPGSWLNTHAVIYANAKRSLITVVDGKWRARLRGLQFSCRRPEGSPRDRRRPRPIPT